MKYSVEVYKEWTEYGTVIVEADDIEDARDQATEMLNDGSEDIEWQGENMTPGNHGIESVGET